MLLGIYGIGGGEFALLIMFAIIIGVLPMIFYLLTLQNTLLAISPQNRRMPPGQVWLTLIPLFGLVWNFIMVGHIADSLKAEFNSRNMPANEERPGYGIGLAYSICFVCSIIPVLGGLASLGGLVCWIIYWVKISNYKNQLTTTSQMY